MAERTLVIDHLRLNYEGLFNAAEFYNLIAGWFYEKGWDWYEKLNQEQVTPTGRQITWVLEPWKSASDFNKLKMAIKVILTDVKEVEVTQGKETLQLNHGVIHMTFDGYVVSDRKGKWKSRPFYWFLGILTERYFLRHHFAKMERWIESDVEDIHTKIKNYLNVFKYTYGA
ncbi:hypothetical protein HYT55_05770 [Candidatus Woesearchaeota archaeon]|nr:hypothetical protein [Candidatus Woesearchaeota archaeon]